MVPSPPSDLLIFRFCFSSFSFVFILLGELGRWEERGEQRMSGDSIWNKLAITFELSKGETFVLDEMAYKSNR